MENIKENILILLRDNPYMWIFLFMTLESMFIPFPSEIVMIPAGYFAAQGYIDPYIAIIIGVAGSIMGALINYWIAMYGGVGISKNLLGEKKHNMGITFFKKYGDITTFVGRLIPLIRQFISFPAGLFRMNIGKFMFYTGLGALIWVSFLVWLGRTVGNNTEVIGQYKMEFLIGIVILAIIVIISKLYIVKQFEEKTK